MNLMTVAIAIALPMSHARLPAVAEVARRPIHCSNENELPAAQADLELLDGDRVVFVGNTFIERDQAFGYLETILTARWPERNITFRNLGWSGDTVWGEARARFGTAADGFQHLKEHVESIRPTVLFIGYGANEAFDGEPGLAKFERGLGTLLDMLEAASAPGARMILLSPLPLEDVGPPLPDPKNHNKMVKRYAQVIQAAADKRSQRFVDLTEAGAIGDKNAGNRATDNGVHLTPYGYWRMALRIAGELGNGCEPLEVKFRAPGRPVASSGTELTKFDARGNRMRYELKSVTLPAPLAPVGVSAKEAIESRRRATLGLPAGRYVVRADDVEIGEFQGERPPTIELGPEYSQVEQLRLTIIEKNRLYFHRWRPQNETYLFGFRKHEQGNNAAEVPKFDPLVEEMEKRIAELRVPTPHSYEIITKGE
jgi:lysophospholipase L1-like esterase